MAGAAQLGLDAFTGVSGECSYQLAVLQSAFEEFLICQKYLSPKD